MSLYEDQVGDVAAVTAKLASQTELTDREVAGAVSSMTDFFKDTGKTIDAVAVLGTGGMKKVGESVNAKIKSLEERKSVVGADSKEGKEITKHLQRLNQLNEAIKSGDIRSTAVLMDIAGADAQRIMMSELGKKLEGMGGTIADKVDFLRTLKLPESAIQGLIRNPKYFEELGKNFKDGSKENFDDMMKTTKEVSDKTGAPMDKLLNASKDYFQTNLANQKEMLKVLSVGGAALGGGATLLGTGGDLLGAGADAFSIFKTIKDLKKGKSIKDIASLAGGGLKAVGGTGVKALATGGMAGLAKVGGGVALAGAGGYAAGQGINALDELISTKLLGREQGFTEDLRDSIWNIFSDDKVLSTEDAFKKVEEDAKRRYQEMKAKRAKTMAAPRAALPSPTTTDTGKTGSVAAAGGGGSVQININGGDIDKVRRVVVEEVNRINKGRA
jgi:hypothetical protein